MMTSHGFASMVTVNIVQTLRNQSVIVSFGREKKMEKKETVVSENKLSELISRGGLIEDFKIEESKIEPPTEPMKLSVWLVDRGLEKGIRLYGNSGLRKIANYLLIYCGDEND